MLRRMKLSDISILRKINMHRTRKVSSVSEFILDIAIRHALTTPAEARRSKEEFEWLRRAKSADPMIAADAFKEEWTSIKKRIENKADVRRLKKKFGIT